MGNENRVTGAAAFSMGDRRLRMVKGSRVGITELAGIYE